MSIATEIERIKSAKESIINTLKANDVEISETATIDELDVTMKEVPILDTTDATATASDILIGKTAYVNSEKVTGEANPIETTITPSATEQVKEGLYSKVTVTGDSNLVAENIAKDITIFGVQGTHEGGGDNECNAVLKMQSGTSFSIVLGLNKIASLDLEGITSMASAFQNCAYLVEVGGIVNSGGVTNATSMFSACSRLKKVPYFDTSNVTDFSSFFYNCQALEEMPKLNMSKAKSMKSMCYNCKVLTKIPDIDISTITNIRETFDNCIALKEVPELNMCSINTIMYTFRKCSALTTLGGFKDLGKAYTTTTANYTGHTLDLSASTKITHDSLMNVINKLYDLNLSYDVANGGTLYTQQLVLGSTNLAKLTSEEVAIATAKGFTVS